MQYLFSILIMMNSRVGIFFCKIFSHHSTPLKLIWFMRVTLFYCWKCLGGICFELYYGLCFTNPVRLLYILNIKMIINIRTRVLQLYILVDSLLWNTLLSLQKYNKIMKPSLHISRHNDSLIIHNASKILLECTVDV